MTDLAKRLLASIDVHVVSRFDGICKLYAHESRESILEACKQLQTSGWIKMTWHNVQTGPSKKEKRPLNLRRTKKQMYTEQTLFDASA